MSDTEVSDPAKSGYAKEILAYFNAKIVEFGSSLSPIKVIQGKRLEALRARVRQYGIEGVKMAIDKAAASSFMSGDNARGWMASFDWIFRPNNFPKVLEGNYDNEKEKPEPRKKTASDYYPEENWQ